MVIRLDKKDKIFIGILVLVHAVFFCLACLFQKHMMGDSAEYLLEAANIKEYFIFSSAESPTVLAPEALTQRQPLYPLFLLLVGLISMKYFVVVLQIAQGLLSIFNIWYVRKVLLSIGYQKKYDWLLLLFVAAYPAQFINANTIAPDILLQTFTLLYFGNFIALFQKKELKYALFMSLALIAGIMVKPVLYPFVWVHVIIIMFICVRHKMLSVRTLLLSVTPLCAMLLYNYFNYVRTGKFHFSSNQAQNASYYYYPFIMEREGMDSANRFLENEKQAYYSYPEYKDRYDHANQRGMEMLKQNFFPYLLFHLKNSARIFIEPGKAEMDLFTGKLSYTQLYSKEQTGFYATWKTKGMSGMGAYIQNNPSLVFVVLALLFNCVRLAGLFWFFRDSKIHWIVRLFVFSFAAYFAVAAGPIANTRYFLPVSLIVIGCAVLGFTNRRNKTAATA